MPSAMRPSLRLGMEGGKVAMQVVVDIIEQTGGLVYLVGQCLRCYSHVQLPGLVESRADSKQGS